MLLWDIVARKSILDFVCSGHGEVRIIVNFGSASQIDKVKVGEKLAVNDGVWATGMHVSSCYSPIRLFL